jgi:hypothetical protein
MLISHRPLRCVKALTRQHIIISSAFKLEASSQTHHLTGYRVRKLTFSFSLKPPSNRASFPHEEELIMCSYVASSCLKFWILTSQCINRNISFCSEFYSIYQTFFHQEFYFLRWFLAWLILWPNRWRWNVPPKRQLTFNELHSIIYQKTELFTTTAIKTSNTTFFHQFIFDVLYLNLSPHHSRRC